MRTGRMIAILCAVLLTFAFLAPSFAGGKGQGYGGRKCQRLQTRQRLRDGSCLQRTTGTMSQDRERIQTRERNVEKETLREQDRLQDGSDQKGSK